MGGQYSANGRPWSKKLPAFKAHGAARADIEAQVKRLMGRNSSDGHAFERLQHYPRYLKAVQVRLDKLKANPTAGRPG